MKAIDGYNKLRGGYYTPSGISDFIVKWAIRNPEESVLEPSCGDGSFLSAVKKRALLSFGVQANSITGIELDPKEAKKQQHMATRSSMRIFSPIILTRLRDAVHTMSSWAIRRSLDIKTSMRSIELLHLN